MLKVGQKLHFGLKVCNVNDNNIIKTTREKKQEKQEKHRRKQFNKNKLEIMDKNDFA